MDFLKEKFLEVKEESKIDPKLFDKYNVKIGLRNQEDGRGVLVGLTKIGDVYGYYMDGDKKIDDDGHLILRGYDLYDIVAHDYDNFGYERVCFLLLFGHLPSEEEAKSFIGIIQENYQLPDNFTQDVLLKNPSNNLMNHLMRAMLSLYSYDKNPDDTDPLEIMRKGLSILAKMPTIINYAYQANRHLLHDASLILHKPKKEYSMAENLLYMLKGEDNYSKEEVDMLDLALIIHSDHGGAPNSTFVDEVISSTGTDLYSSLTGALGALKGPRHGGANKEVMEMMNAIIDEVSVNATDQEIKNVLNLILDKKFYNKTGLIYGIGHAVYTKSDPRACLLKKQCESLSRLKGKEKLFDFYRRVEEFSIEALRARKGEDFHCCCNVDFYSGLAYQFLGIPTCLFTPIFACSRMIGWICHDIETKINCNKIVRPANKYVGDLKKY